uniref:Uncharacterized protein n=1 Tax=Geladintestivirus 3 TaxID=3233135 RepID=A0AAU8MJX4_9CAUD
MLVVDDNGVPKAPSIRQLMDKDIKSLYEQDKTSDKTEYIKQCIVIYYLGDPKSPAKQQGLSDAEALKMAIEQAGLPASYHPTALMLKIIRRYYAQQIGEAGRVVENLLKTLHNVNLSIDAINDILNEKLRDRANLSLENADIIMSLTDKVADKAKEMPKILKALEEAKENLMYEKEAEVARGGNAVSSSMDASAYN